MNKKTAFVALTVSLHSLLSNLMNWQEEKDLSRDVANDKHVYIGDGNHNNEENVN